MRTPKGFKYALPGKKIQMLVGGLLVVCFCLAQTAATGYADDVESSTAKQIEAQAEKKQPEKRRGHFLPIPIFLTEPAIGYGLGLALTYIHPEKDDTETQKEPALHTLRSAAADRSGQKPPPTMTGVAGGYTEKDTWALAVGHSASWFQDTVRYVGALARTDVNATFYIVDRPADFNLKGAGLYQDIKFRLGESKFFLGGKLLLLDTESEFDLLSGIDPIESSNYGLAATGMYDTRDNTFTPNKGQLFSLDIWRYDEALGGDFDYWRGDLKLLSFWQMHRRFVLGLRFETSTVDGSAPFYAYPWVSLRGIPAMRYQGKTAGQLEVEGRWNILERWALVGFAGSGAVHSREVNGVSIAKDDIFAGGLGVRYFLMRDLGLWLGIDGAKGPEDEYLYITVGQAW